MSNFGTWPVLFRAKDLPTLDQVLTSVRSVPGIRASSDRGGVLATDEETGVVLRIAANGVPVVREEAEELAELAPPADADVVRACNARFEISWPVGDAAEVTNALCLVTEALARVVGGRTFVFDPDAGEFV